MSYMARDGQAKPDRIFWHFAQRAGYGSVLDYVEDCNRRFGDGATRRMEGRLDEAWERLMGQTPHATTASTQGVAATRSKAQPHLALLSMPDADFRAALEHGLLLSAQFMEGQSSGFGWDATGSLCAYVNDLFELRGVPYRLTRDIKLEYHGDVGLRQQVVDPALAALQDPRLAGARNEFEDALVKLGAGAPKDVEDAVEESRKAVESVMKALLDAHQLPRHLSRPPRR